VLRAQNSEQRNNKLRMSVNKYLLYSLYWELNWSNEMNTVIMDILLAAVYIQLRGILLGFDWEKVFNQTTEMIYVK